MFRVALTPSSYGPNLGGVEQLSARLAASLTASGCHVGVVTSRWPPALPEGETIDGVLVQRVNFAAPERRVAALLRFAVHFPRAAWRTVGIVRRLGADVVHVQCVSTNALYALLAARLLRLPLVVTLQGELTMDTHQVYQRSQLLPWLLRHLLRRADAVTACSAQTLLEAETLLGVQTGERGSVIYNGVDLAEFEAPPLATERRRYILTIGRHVPEKGFDLLIEAYAKLGRDDVRLVIAGDGPERPTLERLAKTLGVADRVDLPGRTDRAQTVQLFQNCEFFVLPSRHEPFGIVNVEAMASGKAVLAASVGGVPEIVHDGENGLLVRPDDPAALAEGMRVLLDDPELSDRLGATGRGAARAYSWPHITEQYLAVYEAATTRRFGSRRAKRSDSSN
jgi:glycosyltransferase involved in cell wall biosynthesis